MLFVIVVFVHAQNIRPASGNALAVETPSISTGRTSSHNQFYTLYKLINDSTVTVQRNGGYRVSLFSMFSLSNFVLLFSPRQFFLLHRMQTKVFT